MKNSKDIFLYSVFYLLFSPDTWRVLIGFAAALIIGPRVTAGSGYTPVGQVVVWLMILGLGYVLSAPVGRFISKRLTAAFSGRGKTLTSRRRK